MLPLLSLRIDAPGAESPGDAGSSKRSRDGATPPPAKPMVQPRRGLRNIVPVSTGPLRLGSDPQMFFHQIVRLVVKDMSEHSMPYQEKCRDARGFMPMHIVDGSNLFREDEGSGRAGYPNFVKWADLGTGLGRRYFDPSAVDDTSGPVVVIMKKDNWTTDDVIRTSGSTLDWQQGARNLFQRKYKETPGSQTWTAHNTWEQNPQEYWDMIWPLHRGKWPVYLVPVYLRKCNGTSSNTPCLGKQVLDGKSQCAIWGKGGQGPLDHAFCEFDDLVIAELFSALVTTVTWEYALRVYSGPARSPLNPRNSVFLAVAHSADRGVNALNRGMGTVNDDLLLTPREIEANWLARQAVLRELELQDSPRLTVEVHKFTSWDFPLP